MISGHRYAADIELWPASALVPAGGSLLLTIRGADADTIGQFRHDDPDDRPSSTFAGWTTLHTDEQADSWVLLHTADHE